MLKSLNNQLTKLPALSPHYKWTLFTFIETHLFALSGQWPAPGGGRVEGGWGLYVNMVAVPSAVRARARSRDHAALSLRQFTPWPSVPRSGAGHRTHTSRAFSGCSSRWESLESAQPAHGAAAQPRRQMTLHSAAAASRRQPTVETTVVT